MTTTKPIKPDSVICVHSGVFHGDEVFSSAVFRMIEPGCKIIRSRSEFDFLSADFLVDVGGKYDPSKGFFDHHQEDFDVRHPSPGPKYDKGPKMSSIGLIWTHYGKEAIKELLVNSQCEIDEEGVDFIHEQICRNIVAPLDAIDNGETRDFYIDTGAYRIPSIVRLIQNMNPTWVEKAAGVKEDDVFPNAVNLAVNYLSREIFRNFSVYAGRFTLLDKVKDVDSRGLLILDDYVPWAPIFSKHPEETKHIKMVIFPSNDVWMVQSPYYNWKTDANRFTEYTKDGKKRKQRYPAPECICGKTNGELSKIVGIDDGVFCHVSGFIAGTKSKESAVTLAEFIIENQDI